MGLIDTHTHLESFARRGDLPAILQRAREAGVTAMVTIGTDADDWTLYRNLAAAHPGFVHYTAGLHPCSVDERWAERFALLEGFWTVPGGVRPVGLGEIGLDRFHLPKDDAAAAARILGWQKDAFAAGLALAKKLGCPVVVHSRGAFAECVEMIDASGVAWGKEVELTRRGGYGSFTGILTYKTAEAIREAAKAQGLARFMLETDAPYLTPVPHRGKPNEPAYIRHTAEFAAGVFGVGYETLVETSAANARRFFGLAG